MVPVREDYQTYRAPAWVAKTVTRLLASLSDAHVAGLSAIVLTESAKIRPGKTCRRAGRKYWRQESLGFYRGRWQEEPPAIFLIVDNILRTERRVPSLQIARDEILGHVLFHEIGHHLHATVGSHAVGSEASADAWGRRLMHIHFWKTHWYLRPVAGPLRVAARQVLTCVHWWRR